MLLSEFEAVKLLLAIASKKLDVRNNATGWRSTVAFAKTKIETEGMAKTRKSKSVSAKRGATSLRDILAHIDFLEEKRVRGNSFKARNISGKASVFRVHIRKKHYIDLAYTRWETGERDVHVLDVESSNRALKNRLTHGLRLGIKLLSKRVCVVELRQAQIKDGDPNAWSSAYKASLSQLSEGAGLDIVEALKIAGAELVGTKEEVLGESGRNRNFICATFPEKAIWPPVVAYVATRILPLLRGVVHR